MKDIFIPFELALWARDLGFDEPCVGKYSGGSKELKVGVINQQMATWLLAPTYQQILDWLREQHSIFISHSHASWGEDWFYSVGNGNVKLLVTDIKDYYEAFDSCLIKVFKIIDKND